VDDQSSQARGRNAGERPSEQLRDQGGRPGRAARVDRPVGDLAPNLVGDRGCDLLRAAGREVHRPPGGVALEAVADVEVLLEVVAEKQSNMVTKSYFLP
jgi:hypothetical protein